MISLDEIGKQFRGTWVFRNINLEINSQESIVILGPSGSGKSVLLKIIAGLLEADEGHSHLKTKNIGMLFQKNALFDSLTVEQNLLFPLRERLEIIGTQAKEKVSRFLSAVGLEGTEELYPYEISGGMQKRLGIARALIVNPELMLYDEPTAGLDPITSKTIAELIQNLRAEMKSTLLIVTNDVQRAYQIGDRIFLLAQGRLIAGGSAHEVQGTQDPVLKQFIYGLQDGPLTAEIRSNEHSI